VSFDLVRLQLLINQLLGRRMDLVSYRELKPGLDDEVPQEAVAL
jgi:predicted nucleotidyltransferase